MAPTHLDGLAAMLALPVGLASHQTLTLLMNTLEGTSCVEHQLIASLSLVRE